MTAKTFILKLNWRQILLHFIATWFFLFAFQELAYLRNLKKAKAGEIFYSSGVDKMQEYLKGTEITPGEELNYIFDTQAYWIFGLIIAFVVSLIISKKKKWFWFNSLIVFIVTFILGRTHFLGWAQVKEIFFMPGRLFHNIPLKIITNGLAMLLLGIFVFSFKKFNDFINAGKMKPSNSQ